MTADERTMYQAVLAVLTERTIAYNAALARRLHSVTAGVLLAQLLYWSKRTENPDGWVWKTQAMWEEETALTRYEQETARKVLVKAGVMEEKLIGVPARLNFRITADNMQAIIALLGETPSMGKTPNQGCEAIPSMGETPKLVSGKPPNSDAVNPQTIYTETTSETTSETTRSASQSAPPPDEPDFLPFSLNPKFPREATLTRMWELLGWPEDAAPGLRASLVKCMGTRLDACTWAQCSDFATWWLDAWTRDSDKARWHSQLPGAIEVWQADGMPAQRAEPGATVRPPVGQKLPWQAEVFVAACDALLATQGVTIDDATYMEYAVWCAPFMQDLSEQDAARAASYLCDDPWIAAHHRSLKKVLPRDLQVWLSSGKPTRRPKVGTQRSTGDNRKEPDLVIAQRAKWSGKHRDPFDATT